MPDGVAVSVPAPAHAAAIGFERCPRGTLCLFADDNGYGSMWKFNKASNRNLEKANFGDIASSVWNRSPQSARLYVHDNFHTYAVPGDGYAQLRPNDRPQNLAANDEDDISSVCLGRCPG